MKHEAPIVFNYDCELCGKHISSNKSNRFPVIDKVAKEKIWICETCYSFVKYNGIYSTYEVVKT
jgi:predicted SprT family Zn-dependent metalloprotease